MDITKAFSRSAKILALNQKDVSDILGIRRPTIFNRIGKAKSISLDKKEGEIALIFLRIFRSLNSLFGGNEETMRQWFNARNHYLKGIPKELIRNIRGLMNVADYLDAMRGKV